MISNGSNGFSSQKDGKDISVNYRDEDLNGCSIRVARVRGLIYGISVRHGLNLVIRKEGDASLRKVIKKFIGVRKLALWKNQLSVRSV